MEVSDPCVVDLPAWLAIVDRECPDPVEARAQKLKILKVLELAYQRWGRDSAELDALRAHLLADPEPNAQR